jgi:putative ABC transport system permease protein
MMHALWQDTRHSLRLLGKHPSFTAVAVITLALGIGANTAIFSVVNAVLLRPLPYPGAEGLVRVEEMRPAFRGARSGAFMTNETFHAWRESTQTLEGIAAYGSRAYTLTGQGEPVRVRGSVVSPALFPMLRVAPLMGTLFAAGTDRPGADRVALISESAWDRRFQRDPSIVGRAITLDGNQYTVAGVLPARFYFPNREAEIWTPFVVEPASTNPGERRVMAFPAIARLKDGVAREQAEAEGTTIVQRAPATMRRPPGPGGPGGGSGGGPQGGGPRGVGPQGADSPGPTLRLVNLQDEMVADVKPALYVLVGAVALVLLIAAANLANLMLVRGAARQRELAVRAAIGAGRGRLLRQLLTESLVLSLAGGVIGVALAWWLVRMMPAIAPGDVPRLDEVSLDLRVLGFACLLSIASGIVFGLLPAWRGARVDVVRAINEAGVQATGGFRFLRGNRLRAALVVSELALALVLLVGAGLLLNSFVRLINVSPGYDPDNVITAQLNLPRTKYPGPAAQRAFFDGLLDRLRSVPGVQAVGMTNLLPLTRGNVVLSFEPEGQPPAGPDEDPPRASLRIVSPGFFEALGIPLVEGRAIGDEDRAGTTPAVVVNEALARQYFERRALGRRLNDFLGENAFEIVGVAGDVRSAGLDSEPQPEAFVSYRQVPDMMTMAFAGFGVTLTARAQGDPLALVAPLRREVLASDSDIPLDDVQTMEARLSASVAEPRFFAAIIGAFAALSLVLAIVGIYGVLSYTVSQRHREIGVRLALGARRPDIIRLVLRQGLTLVGIGLVLGLAGSLGVTRFLKTLLFGVTTTDPATFAGISALVVIVALVACLLPARRATRVDPMEALRYE